MGYAMNVMQGKFQMRKAGMEAAFRAYNAKYGGTVKDLPAALLEHGWEAEVEPTSGGIKDLSFVSEKFRDDDELFQVLAPFVEPGSYLVMHGEDDDIWRWYFDGRKLLTDGAAILFSPRVDITVKDGRAKVSFATEGITVRIRHRKGRTP